MPAYLLAHRQSGTTLYEVADAMEEEIAAANARLKASGSEMRFIPALLAEQLASHHHAATLGSEHQHIIDGHPHSSIRADLRV
ncbi:MAG: hypothetical protein WBM08_14945 [Prochlorococcaceae cyanobacterium]